MSEESPTSKHSNWRPKCPTIQGLEKSHKYSLMVTIII